MKCLGAIVGDICGKPFEFVDAKVENYELLSLESRFTDDTVMTIAFMAWLESDDLSEDNLVRWIAGLGQRYWFAGYGPMFSNWLSGYSGYKPYNSFGNGSGMRTSPIGWFFDNIDDVLKYAEIGSSVTHNHPEGIKGAQAISAAIYFARNGASKEQIKNYIESKFGYDLNRKVADMVPDYKFEVSCQKSVPESIICFLESSSVETAIQNAIWMGGDTDTMADMAAAIAEAYYGGDETEKLFQKCREKTKFPDEFVEVIEAFNKKI